MAKNTSFGVLITTIFVLLIMSGCGVLPASPQQQVMISPSATRIIPPTSTASPIPLPTNTKTPSPTPGPKVFPTLTPTQEPSPLPTLSNNELANAKFFSYGFLENWRFFVSINNDKPIVGQYYALIGEKYRLKLYKCEVFPAYPNRLVCSGELSRIDDWVEYTIYPIGSELPAFQGRISVPMPYDVYPMSSSN